MYEDLGTEALDEVKIEELLKDEALTISRLVKHLNLLTEVFTPKDDDNGGNEI